MSEVGDTKEIVRHHRDKLPRRVNVRPDGSVVASGGTPMLWMKAPFVYCPTCDVGYAPRIGEVTKLGSLNVGGRSTANTTISLALLREIDGSDLAPEAKKLLTFTDNRRRMRRSRPGTSTTSLWSSGRAPRSTRR